MSRVEVKTFTSNCERAGRELVRQAKEQHDARIESGRREVGAAAKEIASYLVHKNRDRKFFY